MLRLCLVPLALMVLPLALAAQERTRVVVARVVALDQPFMWNRLGTAQPNGTIYALERDVVPLDTPLDSFGNDVIGETGPGPLVAGNVRLRSGRRARPLVLRVNEGEILEIEFTNLLAPKPTNSLQVVTRHVSAHVMGLELAPDGDVPGINSDGSWVGKNPGRTGSIAAPGERRRYRYYASREGIYIIHAGAGWQGSLERSEGGLLGAGLFGSVIVQPKGAEYYRSQVTRDDLAQATTGRTPAGQPEIDYRAVYRSGPMKGLPILEMTRPLGDGRRELICSDLTAIITGPNAGRFPEDDPSPSFRPIGVYPERRRPYREVAVHYHEFLSVQSFPQFYDPQFYWLLLTVQDNFAINYGMAGMGAEVLANRMGVGPAWRSDSVDLKFEEFFLSSWANGDPAMVVDVPANAPSQTVSNPAQGSQVTTPNLNPPVFPAELPRGPKATKAFYPDDPSNVYHAYIGDRTKFRIVNAAHGMTHVHHQHAHQWLHTPNSDSSTYMDSQLISPGGTYTLEIAHDAGNANKTVGDAIFHCHFYVHFAAGMWALWRVHDVFEEGTMLGPDGRPLTGVWNRAYPDAEIATGTPIPAVVPLPTYAMAPMPAEIRLIDEGRRVEVKPSGEGPVPRYDNPGYPFFVPGIAGHRAPHPPMDFAMAEGIDGKPVVDGAGKRVPLDGGLRRHMVLGGEIAFEAHTRWDWSKDFIRYENGQPVAGNLLAYELPNDGTLLEQAAMAFHSRASFPSFTPAGEPKPFALNGRPPIPGAPFADPRNAGTDFQRRYQAAVVQRDVVQNRNGWHQPQSRIITLWEDVAPTMSGERPPEPMFLRSNSGDAIEYWHTNLVPNKYNLDDFLVRTPTDILGQHIHLVKYDILAADGAANGFNYEDGTFSPDEVRERIDAVNRAGGLFAFDERTQFADRSRQMKLTAKPASAVFGPAPAGQNWLGAQTTVQMWDSEPVLSEDGRDRTMRTVFTHDHFGPTTHQVSGLYAALVTEPKGSKWLDSVTGAPFYTRRDGGPTSWQANIITPNESESYREFNLMVQDSQLAWTRESRSKPAAITSSLFDASAAEAASLDSRRVSPSLRARFGRAGIDLPPVVTVEVNAPGNAWTIREPASGRSYALKQGTLFTVSDPGGRFAAQLDGGQISPAFNFAVGLAGLNIATGATVTTDRSGRSWNLMQPLNWLEGVFTTYPIAKAEGSLAFGAILVSLNGAPLTLSDYSYSVNPFYDLANAGNGAPYPLVVNSMPVPGTYSLNYRNEAIPLRVAPPYGETPPAADSLAVDLSYAFSSEITRLEPVLNRQPRPGEPIDPKQPDGFRFPRRPLLPEGPTGVRPTDPYTPMLRAYEGDRIQIRGIGGANHHQHFFDVQNAMWYFEPAWEESGLRDAQPIGLSEHFEFLFSLQPGSGDRRFTDRGYRANNSTAGIAKGTWGLLRAYDGKDGKALLPDLQPLPNNKGGSAPWNWSDPNLIPPGATVRRFHIVATTGKQALPDGRLTYQARGQLMSVNPLTLDPQQALVNPYALLYFRAEDLDANGKLKPGVLVEPLILRVNAGDWIEVKLTNNIDPAVPAVGAAAFMFSAVAPGTVYSDPSNQINYRTSRVVGLRPQMLAHDPGRGGNNIGFNPVSTAAPGETVTYLWYAGRIDWDEETKRPRGVPIEFGTTVLQAADPAVQHERGLVAALIVEPRGATWTEDRHSRASATVQPSSGARPFREFVTVVTEDALLISREPRFILGPEFQETFDQAVFTLALQEAFAKHGLSLSEFTGITVEDPNRLWLVEDQNVYWSVLRRDDGRLAVHTNYQETVNYGSEPLPLRFTPQPAGFNPDGTNFTPVFSNAQVGGDPQTPVFTAEAGQPVRFRLAHSEGLRPPRPFGLTYVINGHNWQELPFRERSTVLGDNPLSQQLISHEQYGPMNRFDILIPSAGGRFAVPGDYFYGTFTSDEINEGSWGIFRVLPKGSGSAGTAGGGGK